MASVLDLKEVAYAGGGLDIDLSKTRLTLNDLKDIAFAGRPKGGKLVIRNFQMSTLDMKDIAFSNPGNVTFVI